MDDHIVQNPGRCQHKPPVKRESAPRAAASPAGFLIPDSDTIVGTAGELMEVCHTFGKIIFCSDNISLFQSSPLRIGQIGDGAVSDLFLYFQIFCNDPDALLDEKMMYSLFGSVHWDTDCYFAIGVNTDGAAFAAAADKRVRKLIDFTLILNTYCVLGVVVHYVLSLDLVQICKHALIIPHLR